MAWSSPRARRDVHEVVAASCGTWLTTATSASCCSGRHREHLRAERRARGRRTAANASASVRSVGVSTQVAPDEELGVGAVETVLLGAGHRVAADERGRATRAAPLRRR